ncbi:chloride channel protein [Prosthecochloris sp. N3]|uniref:Chloride channel protein n=1 Tax=Prosthecochloris ethylica TaxID=2743976 RepID=A0ABR9XTZ9_9CHLB|nr:chloride channel protein [Prosthecochloris ethylica]MBF0586976.1 chloride channel protein [Prosthecochloris ethylica]MBF0637459.1 chloride channel protein [Prosthecochloris ethylica]MEC9486694.1 chloride channel protein [Prosthecochloris sp.]NUK48535.1 chloride channel protein [Prosthecochloris ethylica]
MKKSSHIKGSWSRKFLAFFYILFRKSRYFKGSPQKYFRLTIDNILLQLNLNQDLPFLFVAVFIGVTTGYVAIVFHDAIKIFSHFFFSGLEAFGPSILYESYWWWFLPLVTAAGGLLVGLYNVYVVRTRQPGHGLASVIKAVAQNDGIIPRKLWLHRTITSVLSIGTGGGGGREAPIAQVGAALGSSVAQILKFSADRTRTLLGCGAAAGLAAVFNAPLGGVMFAIEVILGDFSVRTFSPIVVAAVIGTVVSRGYLGNSPTFQVPDYSLVSNTELVFYFVLGVLAGFSAVLFIKTYYRIEEWFVHIRARYDLPLWAMPAIGGLLTGLVCIWLPGLYGYSYEAIDNAVRGTESWLTMAGIYLLKPVVAGLSVGSGGSGGMFAPAMKMGAMLGGMFGDIVHWVFPAITAASGAYALVGMGAVTAGIMRAPLTVILILFEVTGEYEIVLPIMFAAVTAALIARLAYSHSMETYVLEKEGVRVGYGIALSVAENISVLDVMRTNYVRFRDVTRAEKIVDVFHNTPESNFLVTNDQNEFVGVIRLDEMSILLKEGLFAGLIAEDIVKKEVSVLYDTSKLDEALKLFEISDYDVLPVLSQKTSQLLGIVRQEEAFSYYRKQLNLYGSDLDSRWG